MAYESETGSPTSPQCKCKDRSQEIKLDFDGWYLRLFVGGQVDSGYHARSGEYDSARKLFDYSEEARRDSRETADKGAIPEGEYWIQPTDLRLPGFLDLVSEEHVQAWGNYRITIHHSKPMQRGGFFIHGGKKFGSKGCIDLAGFMDNFVGRLRELLPTRRRIPPYGGGGPGSEYQRGAGRLEFSEVCHIPLNVRYSSQSADMPPWFNQ